MAFTTKLDFSNNRQVKQNIETSTSLSGGTIFGVPFSYLPTGPSSTSGVTAIYSGVVSTFSGNTGTTVYTWYDNSMNIAISHLSALTPSNSGVTQNTGNVFVSSSSATTVDGNIVNLTYSGVSFDVTPISMVSLGGGSYSGTVDTSLFLKLSAGTIDYTGRTIWVDVSGITRTQELIVAKNPTVGYVLTCVDSEGRMALGPVSAATSSLWTAGTGTQNTVLAYSNPTIFTGSNNVIAGYNSAVKANYTFTEGYHTTAEGDYAHAEGYYTDAYTAASHAEGDRTTSSGYASHAEGSGTTSIGNYSHSEGNGTTAYGYSSHAEGQATIAHGNDSHSEGYYTVADNDAAHAEGWETTASGIAAHAEGFQTTASGDSSHAEGENTIASGLNAHAEGNRTTAIGLYSHTEGASTIATGDTAHAEGGSTTAFGHYSHAEGAGSVALGYASHAEGMTTIASGYTAHAGGYSTKSIGDYSFAHGYNSVASGQTTVVFGNNITGTSANTVYVPELIIVNFAGTASSSAVARDANGKLVPLVSDVTLKENINPLTNSLDKIKQLKPVSYQWKDREAGGDGVRLGFIAQEVEGVVPEIVFTANNGKKGINYHEISALLVDAVKELSSGNTSTNNVYLETQSILAEDNNIDLNYNGTVETAIGGGIRVLNALSENVSAEIITDENGNWITNNDFKPQSLTIPLYTPLSSDDANGNEGNVTRDDNYLYVKTATGWKRTNLERF